MTVPRPCCGLGAFVAGIQKVGEANSATAGGEVAVWASLALVVLVRLHRGERWADSSAPCAGIGFLGLFFVSGGRGLITTCTFIVLKVSRRAP